MRRYSRCTTPIGVGVYVCSRFRWWHSLRSFTTGYRNNTPFGVSLASLQYNIYSDNCYSEIATSILLLDRQ